MISIKFKLDKGAVLERKTSGSVGFDLCVQERVQLCKGMVGLYGTGVYWEPSTNELTKHPCSSYQEKEMQVVGLLIARSSLWKYDVQIPTGVGVIDTDYRGEIKIPLVVGSWCKDEEVVIDEGTRLAQLVVISSPAIIASIVDDIQMDTERGAGGFGSTGGK